MKEVFLDIPGYEGLYQISNLGNIKNIRTGKLLKPGDGPGGYLLVDLYKNKERKSWRIHRLVAKAFIPNPQNLPQINHKDEVRTNNTVDNLEWCSAQYNMEYSQGISVLQFDKKGNLIKEWGSINKAGRENNIIPQHIWRVCQGKRKSAGGYIWKYKN